MCSGLVLATAGFYRLCATKPALLRNRADSQFRNLSPALHTNSQGASRRLLPRLRFVTLLAFQRSGEMSERFKEHAWKACVGETQPWVRIPLSPPYLKNPAKTIVLDIFATLYYSGVDLKEVYAHNLQALEGR
jgi:hypothetical protein